MVGFHLPSTKLDAKIAQLVEHRSEESGVVGSIPTLGTILKDIIRVQGSVLRSEMSSKPQEEAIVSFNMASPY